VSNLVPGRYRDVAVATVEAPLTRDGLERHFLGREAYRRTRWVVARRGPDVALVEVRKAAGRGEELFAPIIEVRVLALPGECVLVDAPEVDTGVPSQLARAARERAPGVRCVVVQGRYRHISFILDPAPIRVRVVEVVPPAPPKLLDQASRILEVAEDLPPIELVAELVDLTELARDHPAPRYLLPCRGAGVALDGAEVRFLDERPAVEDWVLLGCARSREIHRWFYRTDAEAVDMCPRRLAAGHDSPPVNGGSGGLKERSGSPPVNRDLTPVLTKCCLLEEHLEVEADDHRVTVPWGASLELVRAGLGRAAALAEPAWAPA
jgi:hypothetical protein